MVILVLPFLKLFVLSIFGQPFREILLGECAKTWRVKHAGGFGGFKSLLRYSWRHVMVRLWDAGTGSCSLGKRKKSGENFPFAKRCRNIAGWWFQFFFIFTFTWGNDPI